MIVAEFLCAKLTMHTTNVIADGVLLGVLFAGVKEISFKVTGNALNIEYYFWWRDYCFGLLIHHDAPFHFIVSISDEYKYKPLVKTTFKLCGKLTFLELYHTRN